MTPQALDAPRNRGRSIESVLTKRWARWLIPSLTDTFFLAMIAWLLMGGGWEWQNLLHDGDAGWHIRTGQYILDQHSVPHRDLYSFSKPGAPWYAWEWGADVLFGGLHRLAGLKAVVLMAVVTLAVFATTLLLRMVLNGVNAFVSLAITMLCVNAASIHFMARPHIFTLLLLSVAVWLISADRDSPSRRVWLLVPLTALWTNLHGGFLALIAVLGLCTLGAAIESWIAQGEWSFMWGPRALRYASLTAACAAVSLLNPYGYALHRHLYEYLRSDWIKNVISEFMSANFHDPNLIPFELMLLGGLMAVSGLLRRGRVVEALWIVIFAHMALGSARHIPVFVTVAGPVVACELSGWWTSRTRTADRKSIPAIVNQLASDILPGFRRNSIWPAAVIVALIATRAPIPWPTDFPSAFFPTRLVHTHAAEIATSRVLTTDQWADYLIYVNPQQKVFVDGRSDFYGPEIGNQYLQLINGAPQWLDVLNRYGFNLALLPEDAPAVQLLKTRPDWRVIDAAGKRVLLVRSGLGVQAVPVGR